MRLISTQNLKIVKIAEFCPSGMFNYRGNNNNNITIDIVLPGRVFNLSCKILPGGTIFPGTFHRRGNTLPGKLYALRLYFQYEGPTLPRYRESIH